MNKRLYSLIDSYRGALTLAEFTKLLLLTSVIIKGKEKEETLNLVENDSLSFPNDTPKIVEEQFPTLSMDVLLYSSKLPKEDLEGLYQALLKLVLSGGLSYKEIIQIALTSNDSKTSAYSIPSEIAELGTQLIPEVGSLYCPFDPSLGFFTHLNNETNVYSESVATEAFELSKIICFLLDIKAELRHSDPINSPSFIDKEHLQHFDATLAFPPLGLRHTSVKDIWGRFPEKAIVGDVYNIRHMLAHSDYVVTFVSSAILHRGAAGEKAFKQDILNQGWLKAVIALPNKLLSFSNVQIYVMVFDKNYRANETLFIDASSEHFSSNNSRTRKQLRNIAEIVQTLKRPENGKYSRIIHHSEIITNDLNLDPSRYVINDKDMKFRQFFEHTPYETLATLATLIRPQATKIDEDGEYQFTEFGIQDINDIGQCIGTGKAITVNSNEYQKLSKQRIYEGDLLIVCKGAVGRVAILDESIASDAVCGQVFCIVRLKEHTKISKEALYQYLISDIGQYYLNSIATGATAKMISAKEMANLKIPTMDTDTQSQAAKIRKEVTLLNVQIQELESKINSENKRFIFNNI